jgi:hypothetical protein
MDDVFEALGIGGGVLIVAGVVLILMGWGGVDERLPLPDAPGWAMFAYTTQPGSPTEERIRLLASLGATPPAEPDSARAWET